MGFGGGRNPPAAAETSFLNRVSRLAEAADLRGFLTTKLAQVRAWPACLRQLAVEHVRCAVRRWELLPRSLSLPLAAGLDVVGKDRATVVSAITDWLCRIRYDVPVMGSAQLDDGVKEALRTRVDATLAAHAATPPTGVVVAAAELEEEEIRRAVRDAFGTETKSHVEEAQNYLVHMNRVLQCPGAHASSVPMDPVALFEAIERKQVDDPDAPFDHVIMHCYRTGLDHTAMHRDSVLTGASSLRPPSLYPSDAV